MFPLELSEAPPFDGMAQPAIVPAAGMVRAYNRLKQAADVELTARDDVTLLYVIAVRRSGPHETHVYRFSL